MIFDPLYMVVMVVGMVLSFGAQMWVKSATSRWDKVALQRHMTGADIASAILRARGIRDVNIEMVGGVLSDHYDPRSKTLRLSQGVYAGRSVTAAGIAAHEVGHAIQHADKYAFMSVRQALVPVANIGTSIGVWMVMIGAMIGALGIAKLGVFIFGGFVLFTVITLPVEIDASVRARKLLLANNIVTGEEARGVSAVLMAAAATYLAAALQSIMQLLYFAFRAGLLGGRRED
jgi:Zn-dependent membrane protease YugP